MKRHLLSIFLLLSLCTAALAGNSLVYGGPGDKAPIIKSFPNPVTSDLTIEIQLVSTNYNKVEVKIVNLLGQEMVPTVKEDLNGLTSSFKIDLRDMPNGFYFMEVTTTAADGSSYTHSKKITKN